MEVIARATVVYFFLWLVARGTGKRQLSEMTAFELILLVTLGDLVQQGVTQEDMSLTGAMLAVGTMTLWVVVFSYLEWWFPRTRPLVEGVPVVVVRDGEPVDEVLRLERVTFDELKEGARNQGISDLRAVRLGVLEPDGKFSFIQ
ncbi:MAG: DUF421 domain-containing protein, partial [Actinomycetota bacterium]|nr:DUF421 domain-containing protein [Actinomycetota bacterium]